MQLQLPLHSYHLAHTSSQRVSVLNVTFEKDQLREHHRCFVSVRCTPLSQYTNVIGCCSDRLLHIQDRASIINLIVWVSCCTLSGPPIPFSNDWVLWLTSVWKEDVCDSRRNEETLKVKDQMVPVDTWEGSYLAILETRVTRWLLSKCIFLILGSY